ncbi:MAG: hypothetical protein DMF69_16375 [Acidobacteria bacterium]|nr:MAG: hypothetical protein DMF69_16375 [Acidobacteriota bacterium]
MRNYSSLVFLLLVFPVISLGQEHSRPAARTEPPPPAARTAPEPGSWIRYESVEGRYSVLLPKKPTFTTQEATTADGVKFPQYMANSTSEKAVCLTGYFDQVEGTVFNFDNARDGMVKAVKGTLSREAPISLDGYEGREFLVSANLNGTDALFRVRIYKVQTRIYVLQFISEKGSESEALVKDSRKYFDSFTPVAAP